MPTSRETFKVYFTEAEAKVVREAAGTEAVSGFIRRTVLNNLGARAENEVGDDKNLRKPGAAGVVQRVSRAPKRTKGTPSEPTATPAFDPRTGGVQEELMCSHDYGPDKCPFPNCQFYKWRKK